MKLRKLIKAFLTPVVFICIFGCESLSVTDINNPTAKEKEGTTFLTMPVITANPQEMDIDGDGSSDYIFDIKFVGTDNEFMPSLTLFLELNPLDNFILFHSFDGFLPFSDGQVIQENMGESFSWTSYPGDILYVNLDTSDGGFYKWRGSWLDVTDKYLPFALLVSDSMYYGWIKMSITTMNDSAFIQITDSNFNENANESIITGQ